MVDLPNENRKKLTTVEVCVGKIETKLSGFGKDLDEIKAIVAKTNEKFDKLDSRYASKRTEQLFYTVLGAGIVYIMYKIIDLV